MLVPCDSFVDDLPPEEPGSDGDVGENEPDLGLPTPEELDPPGFTRIVSPEKYKKRRDAFFAAGTNDEYTRAMVRNFEEFEPLCGLKPLSEPPENHSELIAQAAASHPHMRDLFDHVEASCCRAQLRPVSKELRLPNLLLVGEPGVAKTHSVEVLASLLNLHSHRVSMNGQAASFELRGLGRMWRSTQPGAVAKCFRDSPVSNPVFILDELDKAPTEPGYYGSATNVLLDLLERQTARHFTDECLELELDASHAMFVATANSLARLPEPLVSRFTVIQVPRPSRAQMRAIIPSIFHSITEDEVGLYDAVLPDDVLAALQDCTPREAKLRLDSAADSAAMRAMRVIPNITPPIKLCLADLSVQPKFAKFPIGFAPAPG